MPQNAIIAVTLNCNSGCISCDIWKNDKVKEVSPSFYKHLPSSLLGINITGGEPFLREDLPEIIAVVRNRCKKARIIISTNGLLTQKIKDAARKILEIDHLVAMRVSIDGSEKTHDEIRGSTKGFKKAMDTVRALQEIGVKDLGIGFTVSSKNVAVIKTVYDLANQLGIEFSITVVTSSPIYFGDHECLKPENNDILKCQFDELIRSELSHWNVKRWSRAYYDYTLLEYIKTHRRPFSCDAGENFFYLNPDGNVYPCNTLDLELGNLNNNSFDEIWASRKADEVRNIARECDKCWMVCTAKTAIKRNRTKVASWMIMNRLRTALRIQIR